jgi:ABC-type uncharacterized transport system YnjBCD ATPase subunit
MSETALGRGIAALRGVLLGRTRMVMLVTGVLTAFVVVGAATLDEGEVVRLMIVDDEGRLHETDLWIVEFSGQTYLRAAQPDALWLELLRKHPDVTLERDGAERAYHAMPDDAGVQRERVSLEMARKYGFADRFWSLVADRSRSLAIRLDSARPTATD